MLKPLHRSTILLDRLLASYAQRCAALQRARYAYAVHGDAATEHLRLKLRDPKRRRTRRELRLAIAELTDA